MTVRQEWVAGWPVVIASLFGFALPTIYVYSLGSFIAPLEAEFGWTRTQISSGLSVVTLMGAILSPVVGMFIDRVAPHKAALPGGRRSPWRAGQLRLAISMGSYNLALWLIIPAVLVTSFCLFSPGQPLQAGSAAPDADPAVSS